MLEIVSVRADELEIGMNWHSLRIFSVVSDPRPRGGITVQMVDPRGDFVLTKRFGKNESTSIIKGM